MFSFFNQFPTEAHVSQIRLGLGHDLDPKFDLDPEFDDPKFELDPEFDLDPKVDLDSKLQSAIKYSESNDLVYYSTTFTT